jgi:hypothetical protein
MISGTSQMYLTWSPLAKDGLFAKDTDNERECCSIICPPAQPDRVV